jgi:hypothetical protein
MPADPLFDYYQNELKKSQGASIAPAAATPTLTVPKTSPNPGSSWGDFAAYASPAGFSPSRLPGPIEFLGNMLSGPAKLAYKVVKNAGSAAWDAAKAVKEDAVNPTEDSGRNAAEALLSAIPVVGSIYQADKTAASQARDALAKTERLTGNPATFGDYAQQTWDKGLDVLGGLTGLSTAKRSLSGRKVIGWDKANAQEITAPMTPGERGDALGEGLTQFALLFAPFAKGKAELNPMPADFHPVDFLGDVVQREADRRGVPFDQVMADVKSGNTKASPAAKPVVNTGSIVDGVVTPVDRPIPKIPITPSSSADYTSQLASTRTLLAQPHTEALTHEAIQSEAGLEFLKSRGKEAADLNTEEKVQLYKFTGDFIEAGKLPPEVMSKYINTNELTPPVAAKILADSYRDAVKFSGETLGALGRTMQDAFAETLVRAQHGDADAIAKLPDFEEHFKNSLGDKPMSLLNKIESFRKANIIGNIPVTMHVASSEIQVGLTQYVSHLISGTVEATLGKTLTKDPGKSWWSYYGDAIADQNAVLGLSPKGQAALGEVLNSDPLNKMRFKSGAEFDFKANTLGELVKNNLIGKTPDTMGTSEAAMNKWMQMITVGHRITTALSRQAFYQSRLEGNLDAMGMTVVDYMKEVNSSPIPEGAGERGFTGTFKDLQEQYKKGILDQDLATAYEAKTALRSKLADVESDAMGHMMKQTFQFVPKDGIQAQVLKVYKNIGPLATMILPTFPRFWTNTLRYQMEHSPMGVLNLLSKNFRDQLAAGGLESRMAARKIGDATASALNLGGAMLLRGSQMAGPKYYQFQSSINPTNPDGSKNFIDARVHMPAPQYLFVADYLNSIHTGQSMNLSPAEWTDALLNLRNLSSTPISMVDSVFTQIANSNPATPEEVPESLKKMAGDIASGFFGVTRSAKDWVGLMRKQELIQHETKGEPTTGPIRDAIPGVGASDNITKLPPSINVFTGQPKFQEHPILHGALGLNIKSMTPLEEYVNRLPGMTEGHVFGKTLGTTRADDLVKEEMGKIFQTKMADGHTIGEWIVSTIKSTGMPPDVQKLKLEKQLNLIRNQARMSALARDAKEHSDGKPWSFLQNELTKESKGVPSIHQTLENKYLTVPTKKEP